MRLSDDAANALAAQYVLGTFRGRARRRFEAIVRSDRDLAAVVRRWEGSLTVLAESIEPIEPPKRAWAAIEARLEPRVSASLSFWRSFALMAGALACVLLAAFLWFPQRTSVEPVFVAVLASSDGAPRAVVSMQSPDLVRVRIVKPWKITLERRDLELWALPKDGAPRSLGTVTTAGETRLHIRSSDPRILDATAFAISLEPSGGSLTGAPTGPVLCSGAIARRT